MATPKIWWAVTTVKVPAAHVTRIPSVAMEFRWRARIKPYLLLAPSLVFLATFTYYPMVLAAWQSFFHKALGEKTDTYVGFGNYVLMFNDEKFHAAVLNNVVYAIGTMLPSIFLALLFALLLSQSTRFNNFLRALLFFPTLIPLVAAASLWWFIFLPYVGLLDYYLAKLAVESPDWLGDPDIALYSLMMLTVWKNAGYYMLFYVAGLQAIPQDCLEVALLEGANWWKKLRYVILPLLRPTTVFVVIIALIQVLGNVDHVIVMTKGAPSDSTYLMLFYIYQTIHESYDTGRAAAATVVTLGALLCLSVVSIRGLERGIHYEA